MKNQSSDLTAFYKEYYSWVKSGSKAHDYFTKSDGLCHNVQLWGYHNSCYANIHQEMRHQFIKAELNSLTPFNKNLYSYWAEEDCTKNRKRMAWLRSHCE